MVIKWKFYTYVRVVCGFVLEIKGFGNIFVIVVEVVFELF
jgi:hypothetical protein